MKTYKRNNSTLLYLNSSFNCTKSSSVTNTKSGNGTGYTSAPTISVTSTAGTGAVITCALVGASVTGITIINGGKNYASAPTFVFTAVGEVEHLQHQH